MTFYVAHGHVILPGDDWLNKKLAARRELDAIPEQQRFAELNDGESRSGELHGLLEDLEGATLCDMDGGVIEQQHLTFMFFDEQSRLLVLAVIIDEGVDDGTHATPFDRLFEGKYDPEVLQLTDQDTPYVIVQLDEHGRPSRPATVIQPYGEGAPEGVCGAMTLPPDFVAKLLQLAS